MDEFLTSVAGKHVAFTGSVFPWDTQRDLIRDLRKHRARVLDTGDVNKHTSVLIRGDSDSWKYSDFGAKEANAAKRIREGQDIILVTSGDLSLLFKKKRRAPRLEYVAGEPAERLGNVSQEAFLKVSQVAGQLEREYMRKVRLEQAYLRRRLLNGRSSAECEMCGETLPQELLVAAHIKPRAACTNRDRRDAQNIVFLLCLLGCDALYERGYVRVDEGGRYYVSNRRMLGNRLASRFPPTRKVCRAWRPETEDYFGWHREHRQPSKTSR